MKDGGVGAMSFLVQEQHGLVEELVRSKATDKLRTKLFGVTIDLNWISKKGSFSLLFVVQPREGLKPDFIPFWHSHLGNWGR